MNEPNHARPSTGGTASGSFAFTRLRQFVPAFPAFPAIGEAGPGRDLALDVARSWSLLVVVFGHFVMQITYWSDAGIPTGSNTLSSGNLWPYATWLLQVMPLFFIAGGAVNRGSWERFTGPWSQWMWQRTRRLMRPTLVFLAVMAVLFTIVSALVPRDVTGPLVAGLLVSGADLAGVGSILTHAVSEPCGA